MFFSMNDFYRTHIIVFAIKQDLDAFKVRQTICVLQETFCKVLRGLFNE